MGEENGLIETIAAPAKERRNSFEVVAGEEMPVCVVNCPNEALVYAETDNGVLA